MVLRGVQDELLTLYVFDLTRGSGGDAVSLRVFSRFSNLFPMGLQEHTVPPPLRTSVEGRRGAGDAADRLETLAALPEALRRALVTMARFPHVGHAARRLHTSQKALLGLIDDLVLRLGARVIVVRGRYLDIDPAWLGPLDEVAHLSDGYFSKACPKI